MSTTARARCARISSTYSRSAASPAAALDRQTSRPWASATSIRPAAIVEKYGSAMSCTTAPIIVLWPVATARAWRFAVYPSSATAWLTRLTRLPPTWRGPSLTTRDAVVSDTPARSATSCKVTRAGCAPGRAPRRRRPAFAPVPANPSPAACPDLTPVSSPA